MLFSGQGAANAVAICTSVAAAEPAIGPQQLKQKWRRPMFKGCH
jgi:hypothetical protein